MKNPVFFLFFLITLNSISQEAGKEINWLHTLDGYNTTDFMDIDADQEGNSYVTFLYQGPFSDPYIETKLPEPGYVGAGLIKYSPEGKPLWLAGIKAAWSAWPKSVIVMKNGDILLVGNCDGPTTFMSATGKVKKVGREKQQGDYHHPQQMFLARYTAKGEIKWIKLLEVEKGFGSGNTIVEKRNGEIYMGIHYSGVLLSEGEIIGEYKNAPSQSYKFEILRLSSEGEFLGKHPFERISFDENPMNSSRLSIDSEGSLIMYGHFQKSVRFTDKDSLSNDNYLESRDAFIVKYNEAEEYQWSRKIGGQHYQTVEDLLVDPKGRIYVTGLYGYECIISQGIELVQQTKFEYKSGYSFFYCRFDKNGELDFAQFESQKGWNGTITGRALAMDGKGYVHLFGGFNDTLSFGGRMDPVYSSLNNGSSFYSRWKGDEIQDLSVNFKAVKGWASYSDCVIRNGKCVVGGIYYGTVQADNVKGKKQVFSERDYGRSTFVYSFDVPPLPEIEEESDSIDHLLAIRPVLQCLPPELFERPNVWVPIENDLALRPQIQNNSQGCGVIREEVAASLYPNPTSSLTTLKVSGMKGSAFLQVFSGSGELLFSQDLKIELDEQSFELNFSGVATGTYFLQIQQGDYKKLLKLVKVP